jgi:hypothetical protein
MILSDLLLHQEPRTAFSRGRARRVFAFLIFIHILYKQQPFLSGATAEQQIADSLILYESIFVPIQRSTSFYICIYTDVFYFVPIPYKNIYTVYDAVFVFFFFVFQRSTSYYTCIYTDVFYFVPIPYKNIYTVLCIYTDVFYFVPIPYKNIYTVLCIYTDVFYFVPIPYKNIYIYTVYDFFFLCFVRTCALNCKR